MQINNETLTITFGRSHEDYVKEAAGQRPAIVVAISLDAWTRVRQLEAAALQQPITIELKNDEGVDESVKRLCTDIFYVGHVNDTALVQFSFTDASRADA